MTAAEERGGKRLLLALEFALLFVALPLAYVADLVAVPLIPALWVFAAACLIAVLFAPGFDRARLWNAQNLGSRLVRALVPFLVAAPLLLLATATFEAHRLFAFVRQRPLLWAIVMVLYPILSVYPQGIIYRTFIFHRYRALFPRPWMMVLASAAAFSMAHIVFENWIAPAATLVGGALFARTYARTRSALVTALQHAAFGCFIFTIGLGWYFYHGAV
jgi:hypothetical protein